MNPKKKNAVTVNQVLLMTEEERSKLESVCWHNEDYSEPRCSCIGISDFKVEANKHSNTRFDVSWSSLDGNPFIIVFDLDEPIHRDGDGIWDYGLYLTH